MLLIEPLKYGRPHCWLGQCVEFRSSVTYIRVRLAYFFPPVFSSIPNILLLDFSQDAGLTNFQVILANTIIVVIIINLNSEPQTHAILLSFQRTNQHEKLCSNSQQIF